jgi:hypothetical protein
MRWQITLPLVGLLIFGTVTYHEVRWNRTEVNSTRYFWWSSFRLDKDPLNHHPATILPKPCEDGRPGCFSADLEYMWVEPGVLPMVLTLTALPAFAIGSVLVKTLGRLGVSQLTTFMSAMPFLITAWYFSVGWLLDWWRLRRKRLAV